MVRCKFIVINFEDPNQYYYSRVSEIDDNIMMTMMITDSYLHWNLSPLSVVRTSVLPKQPAQDAALHMPQVQTFIIQLSPSSTGESGGGAPFRFPSVCFSVPILFRLMTGCIKIVTRDRECGALLVFKVWIVYDGQRIRYLQFNVSASRILHKR